MRTDCFIHFNTQLLIWHWETRSYAAHVALGDSYKKFSKLVDSYIEIYQGKNQRLDIPDFSSCPAYVSVKGKEVPEVFEWMREYLLIELTKDLDKTKDVDLLNLRDEMLAELNHLLYLLTLE